MTPSIIHAKDLTKYYKVGTNIVRALDGFDISIAQGAYIALMGPSGSGKSTLMNILGCLDSPVKHKRTLLTNLAASVRFRYQLKTDFKQAFRLSPALYYKVSKKLRLAFYTEFFVRPSLEGLFHSDSRYRFILKYKVSKRRWVSFGYQIEQQKNTPDPRTEHVFICSYDIEMKRRNGKK